MKAGKPRAVKEKRIPYHEGQEIPPGGEVVERTQLGLWVSGTVVLTVAWLTTASITTFLCTAGCLPWAAGVSFIPVVGPILDATISAPEVLPFMISMALIQGAGFGMILGGVLAPKKFIIFPNGPGDGDAASLRARRRDGDERVFVRLASAVRV